jgi:acyl-CoA reductase-like NAD-dependent aldehyde dehydrogenase
VLGGEVLPLADACRFLIQRAARVLKPRRVGFWSCPMWLWGQVDRVERRPRGVIGLIGTWNFPIYLNAVPLLQALTAGNGVLWKPSELAPQSALALFDLLQRAGYPPGLIELLPASREAGQQLAETDVDHVLFTGSSATGRKLAETLGRRLVSSTLELSGCDAMFVLEDANPSLAARAAWFGLIANRGQTCIGVRRVFVHRAVRAGFLEKLEPLAASALAVELAQPVQIEQANRLVKDALDGGAAVLGSRGAVSQNGATFRPLVLVDAQPSMALCREASFAPIMGVLTFDKVDDAMHWNSQCSYGLGASIFSGSPDRVADLARSIPAGMVTINDTIYPTAHPGTPFGGRGQSGWGVTQGEEGLLEMTVPQVVSIRRGVFRPHYDLVQRQDDRSLLIEGFLEAGHAPSLWQRIRGIWKLVRSALGRG